MATPQVQRSDCAAGAAHSESVLAARGQSPVHACPRTCPTGKLPRLVSLQYALRNHATIGSSAPTSGAPQCDKLPPWVFLCRSLLIRGREARQAEWGCSHQWQLLAGCLRGALPPNCCQWDLLAPTPNHGPSHRAFLNRSAVSAVLPHTAGSVRCGAPAGKAEARRRSGGDGAAVGRSRRRPSGDFVCDCTSLRSEQVSRQYTTKRRPRRAFEALQTSEPTRCADIVSRTRCSWPGCPPASRAEGRRTSCTAAAAAPPVAQDLPACRTLADN